MMKLAGAITGLGLVATALAASISAADAAAPAACCEAAGAPSTVTHGSITLDGARRVLDAAVAEARAKNAGGAIAVVDEGGSLVAFERLDGTFAAGAVVSTGKARTSALFKKPTKAFEDAINGGRVALAAVHEMTPLQGGVPIVVDGQVVGAIGVSGAHSQGEDEQIAMAGANAIATPQTDQTK